MLVNLVHAHCTTPSRFGGFQKYTYNKNGPKNKKIILWLNIFSSLNNFILELSRVYSLYLLSFWTICQV